MCTLLAFSGLCSQRQRDDSRMRATSYPEDPLLPETVQLQCRIPASWGRALKRRAQSRGTSISKEFRLALNRYIADERISI